MHAGGGGQSQGEAGLSSTQTVSPGLCLTHAGSTGRGEGLPIPRMERLPSKDGLWDSFKDTFPLARRDPISHHTWAGPGAGMPCSPSPPRPFLYFLHVHKSSLIHPAPSQHPPPRRTPQFSFLSLLPPTWYHTWRDQPPPAPPPPPAPIARPASALVSRALRPQRGQWFPGKGEDSPCQKGERTNKECGPGPLSASPPTEGGRLPSAGPRTRLTSPGLSGSLSEKRGDVTGRAVLEAGRRVR